MKRRAFIAGLGGAVAWPVVARPQQGERMRRVGVLINLTADDPELRARLAAFLEGLRELGWTDGRNIQIETRFGEGESDRIRAHATIAPDVIVANTTPVIRAVRQATSSIPIVMAAVNDPVDQGFVSSLAHPGGNITGFSFIDFQMVGKWLEMLKEVAPGVSRAILMFNPNTAPQYYVYLCVRQRVYVLSVTGRQSAPPSGRFGQPRPPATAGLRADIRRGCASSRLDRSTFPPR